MVVVQKLEDTQVTKCGL